MMHKISFTALEKNPPFPARTVFCQRGACAPREWAPIDLAADTSGLALNAALALFGSEKLLPPQPRTPSPHTTIYRELRTYLFMQCSCQCKQFIYLEIFCHLSA